MYVRLAFAVAAHMETEILLVDEVLGVGDAQFQKKCLGKMDDVARNGRTIMFVSHNMTAIQRLCQTAVWLDRGTVMQSGPVTQVASAYVRTTASSCTQQRWSDPSVAPGNDIVRLRSALVRPQGGSPTDAITIETPFVLEFEYCNLKVGAYLNLSVHIFNEEGVCVFNTAPAYEPRWHGKPFPLGLFRSICFVPGDLMNDGMHRVRLLVVQNTGFIIYRLDDVLSFEVHESIKLREGYLGDWPGAMRPKLTWTTELVEGEERNS
jgi:lipopolysaccharide transport system ATP-binding protein